MYIHAAKGAKTSIINATDAASWSTIVDKGILFGETKEFSKVTKWESRKATGKKQKRIQTVESEGSSDGNNEKAPKMKEAFCFEVKCSQSPQ